MIAPMLAALTPMPPAVRNLPADGMCDGGRPEIRVNVSGLRDEAGTLRVEAYPATQADFLKNGDDLLRSNKFFRRVSVPARAGKEGVCVAVPVPGRYAIVVIHRKRGSTGFDLFRDGVGVPGRGNIGRSKPKLAQAEVLVTKGIVDVDAPMQYLRGFAGFTAKAGG